MGKQPDMTGRDLYFMSWNGDGFFCSHKYGYWVTSTHENLIDITNTNPKNLNPEQIFYSQHSINRYFSSDFDTRWVVNQLRRGTLVPEDFPPVEVVWHQDRY